MEAKFQGSVGVHLGFCNRDPLIGSSYAINNSTITKKVGTQESWSCCNIISLLLLRPSCIASLQNPKPSMSDFHSKPTSDFQLRQILISKEDGESHSC